MRTPPPPLVPTLAQVKPHLRGWLHLGILPLTLAGGIVLVACRRARPPGPARRCSWLSALLLFGVSAAYHCGNWSPPDLARPAPPGPLQHLPAGRRLLHGVRPAPAGRPRRRRDARHGLVQRAPRRRRPVRLADAPRWLSPPIYVALRLGCARLQPAPRRRRLAARAASGRPRWSCSGSARCCTSVGGVVYFLQRPDPWPRWFGFHEVFHAFTVVAFASHYAGLVLAAAALR